LHCALDVCQPGLGNSGQLARGLEVEPEAGRGIEVTRGRSAMSAVMPRRQWAISVMRVAGTRSDPAHHCRTRQTLRAAKYSGPRITVWDVLSWLAAGMTEEKILADYPELERDDFRAVYDLASRLGKRVAL
jgi:hypothetical protein